MAALTAYMAFTSRGKPFDIKIPNDPRALAAYQNGKEYFYTRRGQLNFSCFGLLLVGVIGLADDPVG